MRRRAKAESAFTLNAKGSGPSSRRPLALIAFAALLGALALAVSAQAAKVHYDSFGTQGSGAGQLNTPRDVAVNDTSGEIYVVDQGNHRIARFDANGNFISAWGRGVSTGAAAPQTCTTTCQAGTPGSAGGEFNNPQGIDINQDTGDLYVRDRTNLRVQQFDEDGAFIRAWGWDVNSVGGPNDTSEVQTVTVDATGGSFTLTYSAQTTAAIAFDASAATLQSALEDLSNIAPGEVGVTGSPGGPWTVTFTGAKKGIDQAQMSADATALTGGAQTAVVATTTQGATFTGFEICASNCKAGTSGGNGGQFKPVEIEEAGPTSTGIAVNPVSHNVYVGDPGNLRLQEFGPNGAFVRLWGPDVVPNGKLGDLGEGFEICASSAAGDCQGGTFGVNGGFGSRQPSHVAVDALGVVYASAESTSVANRIARFDSTAASPAALPKSPIEVNTVFKPSVTTALEVDRTTGHLLIAQGSSGIARLDLSANPATVTSSHIVAVYDAGISANGLGVNGTNGNFYASTTSGGHSVHRFIDPPPHPPVPVTGDNVEGPAAHLRTLEGTVNPDGFFVTECRFVYGRTTAYGRSAPCVPSAAALGDGTSELGVSTLVGPLDPEAVYHYRLVVANAGHEAQGEDRTFTTAPAAADPCPNAAIRAQQGIAALAMPDCMALEQISPQKKENQYATLPEVSVDAGRIRYYSGGALDDPLNLPSAFWNRYVASRGESGWTSTVAVAPDPEVNRGLREANGDIFSPDFSRWFLIAATPAQSDLGRGAVYQGGLGGFFRPLSPLLAPLNSGGVGIGGTTFQGASADHAHLYFTASSKTIYLPGDPEPTSGANAYVALFDSSGDPSLELLTRDSNGKAWGGSCGAVVGQVESLTARNQGAISADGSRVYFTTRPTQPAIGGCNTATNKLRIMRRVETVDGPWITHLVPNEGAGECDRVSPACATSAGDDLYQGASVDQTKVYFTTNRQLADSDLDTGFGCSAFFGSPGCDLYLYDSTEPPGERLIQVSAGETNGSHEAGKGGNVPSEIAAISADGSHVYFVAQGVLTDEPNPEGAVAQTAQNNLYLYQRDSEHPDGGLTFVGTANPADSSLLWGSNSTFRGSAYPVPASGKDADGNEVGGDGHVLLFQSKAPLTADDTDGGFADIFRYDSEAETLERVSKAAPGGEDNGPFNLGSRPVQIGVASASPFNGTDWAEWGRWASEDGETVVFKTKEGLMPEDTNGLMDSYLVRGGELYRLPGTTDPTDDAASPAALNDRPTLSHDGSVVAFTSREQLLPSDGDSAIDVYSLRANGGFLTSPEPKVCQGEECQGFLGALPAGVSAASASSPSTGNVKAKQPNACPKGKRKVRRAGKTRCVKKASKKAKKKAKKRGARAGRKQGGQK